MRYVSLTTLAVLLGALCAQADQFYMEYDAAAQTFPEQQGWGRFWGDPEDKLKRSVSQGVFELDTRGSYDIFDLYEVISPAFILGTGEELHLTWRMQTLWTDDWLHLSDVCVGVVNQTHAHVQLFIAPGYVSEDEDLGGEPEHIYFFAPGVPHTYEFITGDMLEYDLFVDGQPAFHGIFHDYAWRDVPRVTFGDTFTGLRSLSEWHYLEVAVVPECGTLAAILAVGLSALLSRRR